MIPPVRCFTCGHFLADKVKAYDRRCEAEKAKLTRKDDEDKSSFRGKIMDDLGIRNVCCRNQTMTAVNLTAII